MDETELNRAMDRYASGDVSAFVPLHSALYPRLYGYLVRMRGSAHIAEDLVQETFLRMHRARSTFAVGASVVPWMYTIARNVLIDQARSAKVRAGSELPADDAPEPIDTAADTESTAVANEAARTVERVLSKLPPAQREAFVLLRYEGLSVQDAANVLGATPSAVKLRAFRAYEALRAALSLSDDRTKTQKDVNSVKPPPGSSRREEVARSRSRGPHENR